MALCNKGDQKGTIHFHRDVLNPVVKEADLEFGKAFHSRAARSAQRKGVLERTLGRPRRPSYNAAFRRDEALSSKPLAGS